MQNACRGRCLGLPKFGSWVFPKSDHELASFQPIAFAHECPPKSTYASDKRKQREFGRSWTALNAPDRTHEKVRRPPRRVSVESEAHVTRGRQFVVRDILLAYCFVVAGIVVGFIIRVLLWNMLFGRLPPDHCYVWDDRVVLVLLAYALLAPAMISTVPPTRRIALFCILALMGAILSSLTLSYTATTTCVPL